MTIPDAVAERIAVALEALAAEARIANMLNAGTNATVPDADQEALREKALSRLATDPVVVPPPTLPGKK